MNWPDFFNGCFEFFGAVMLAMNVWQLHKDKVRKGVHWAPTIFFTSWGFYNLFFYPHLQQWWSFLGGCTIVMVNTIYLCQVWYYSEQSAKCRRWISVRRQAPAGSVANPQQS